MIINIGGHQRGPLTRFDRKSNGRIMIAGGLGWFGNKKNDLGANKHAIESVGKLGR